MKYKVGDTVKMKSAEELMKLGWGGDCAEDYGGKSFKIMRIDENLYYGESALFKEGEIERLVQTEEQPQDAYTFDELKKRVDDLKEYAIKLSSKKGVGLCIEIDTEVSFKFEKEYELGREYKGTSRINIMD